MIYLGADHGGFELKEELKRFLKEEGYETKDLGNTTLDPKDDYPDFAIAVGEHVAEEHDASLPWQKNPKGIVFCRSAAGVVIAANKVKGIRAAAAFDVESARHARLHNDANVLAISGDWLDHEKAKEIVITWLQTAFSDEERHVRRLNKIWRYEHD